MKIGLVALMLACLSLQLCQCSDSDGATLQTQLADTLNRDEFSRLTSDYLAAMRARRTMNLAETITMVRLFNTILVNYPESSEEPMKSFRELFWKNYLLQSVSLLNASVTKGMGYYAKEYDLYIGGPDVTSSRFIVL